MFLFVFSTSHFFLVIIECFNFFKKILINSSEQNDYDLCHEQHPQFDALETRLNRREPAYMDVHSTPPATVPPVVAYGSIPSSPSFHNLNWDGEVCDGENFDSSGNSRPLTVL